MKIPLIVKTYAEGLKPFVSIGIRLSKYHIFGVIEAFVDTGSPWTAISQKDAEKLNIPLRMLHSITPRTIYLGGRPLHGYPMKNIALRFRDEKGKLVKINFKIFILRAISKDKKSLRISRSIPSLLGTDFLMNNKLCLYFNPHERESYLENK